VRIPVEAVIALSQQAGRAIMEIYNSADHGVEYKGDDSPLTKADTESNRIICEGLQQLSPHIPIISEENKALPYSIRQVCCVDVCVCVCVMVVVVVCVGVGVGWGGG
jgi:3'(2'), 5'-bisphosphate nucleotidase